MARRVEVVENILGANERIAGQNRRLLDEAHLFAVNLMASPGAGKTSLIEKTVEILSRRLRILVIDGDLATDLDADRARAAGAEAVQINTGGECHLDANMVALALQRFDLAHFDLLIIENVGNLICPVAFALGSHKNILIASVPEGDDKPYKYPGTYRGVDVLVINKVDLLPYVPFQMDRFQKGVELLNPGVVTFPLSCRTGEGISAWTDWLLEQIPERRPVNG
ncbi:MAG: hydrogenase nickel incorporation protein HypB [Anaerolineales bacterium]|jgi:hydrogenase nickel incorporation protein HypB